MRANPIEGELAAGENPDGYCVPKPTIEEVVDTKTGEVRLVKELLKRPYVDVMRLRQEATESIVRGSPRFLCIYCLVPTRINCEEKRRRFHFKHKTEDGRCSLVTRGKLNQQQIDALRFNGVKESEAHKSLKKLLRESLEVDPAFSEIVEEKVWRGEGARDYRKPDVRATFGDQKCAFEVQLATTYLNVIAERREFYRAQSGLLVWILKDVELDSTRLSQEDLICQNNCNALLANERTLAASREAGKLMLECRYLVPEMREDGRIGNRMESCLVAFEDLTRDVTGQRVYYFDYDAARACVELEPTPDQRGFIQEFESFWQRRDHDASPLSPEEKHMKRRLKEQSGYRGLLRGDGWSGARAILNALYSAKSGQPVGWDFNRLVEVPHLIYESTPHWLPLFWKACLHYKTNEVIWAQDGRGAWRKKFEVFKQELKAAKAAEGEAPEAEAVESTRFKHNPELDPILRYLFPELRNWLT